MLPPRFTSLFARMIGALAVTMVSSLPMVLRAQDLTVTGAAGRPDTIPAPKRADYLNTFTGNSGSWTGEVSCGNNVGNSSINACVLRLQLSTGSLTSIQVIAQTPSGGNHCSGGAQTFTLSASSTVDVMRVAKGGGNGQNANKCSVIMTFRVTGISLSAYQSAATAAASTFTRSISVSAVGVP